MVAEVAAPLSASHRLCTLATWTSPLSEKDFSSLSGEQEGGEEATSNETSVAADVEEMGNLYP